MPKVVSCGLAVMATLGLTVTGASASSSSPATGQLAVSVAYAENIGNSAPTPARYPVPWMGAPHTVFLGGPNPMAAECGAISACFDAGAIRLDNPGSSSLTIQRVRVAVHPSTPGGKVYDNLWGAVTVGSGQSVILTENPATADPGYDNFDTSDTPHGGCLPGAPAPTVTLTVGGVDTTLVDSGHVLDTGGVDSGGCHPAHNESVQWQRIGQMGTGAATLSLAPATVRAFVGGSVTERATVLDGTGTGLPNVAVTFRVSGGPNAGHTDIGLTDNSGVASVTYSSTSEGEDVITASAGTVGSFGSGGSRVLWADDSTSGWTGSDIGTPTPAGSQTFNVATGAWTVTGAGVIGGTADSFRMVRKSVAPSSGVGATLRSASGSSTSAQAGLMVRASTSSTSAFYAVVVTPANGLSVLARTADGAPAVVKASVPQPLPASVWIVPSSGHLSAYTSSDGFTWQILPGSTAAMSVGSAPIAGMAVASGRAGQTASALFDNIVVASGAPPGAPPQPCEAGWTCADIGSPTPAGTTSVDGGTWQISAAGSDIHGVSDQFRFNWRPATGDAGLSTRVLAQQNTSPWAKAGVMFRGSTDSSAPDYAVLLTPGNGIVVQVRPALGASTARVASIPGTVPEYLMAARHGSQFTAYTSTDGVHWNPIPGSAVTVPGLPATVLMGLAVTSHNNGMPSAVTMDTVQAG